MERIKEIGYVELAKQVAKRVSERNIVGYAQMVAYNLLFATAPFLMVMVAGAAAITRAVNSDLQNPAQPVLNWMQDTLPAETTGFLEQPIQAAMEQSSGWIFSVGALLALWGARGAVNALIKGLNQAYSIDEDPRSFVKLTAVQIGLTLAMVLLLGLGGLVFALGTDLGATVAEAVGLGGAWNSVSSILRWPLLVVVAVIAVAVLHRYGPAERAPLKWYLPGAIFTVVGGYLATIGLGLYFNYGGGYSETYGIFGSVLAFIFWLFVMGLVTLLGGVINGVLQEDMGPKNHASDQAHVESEV